MLSKYAVAQLTFSRPQAAVKTTSPLGLPAEIRVIIWNLCRPEAVNITPCAVVATRVAHCQSSHETFVKLPISPLLLLNKTIHQEACLVAKQYVNISYHSHSCMVRLCHSLSPEQLDFVSTFVVYEYEPSHTQFYGMMGKYWRDIRDTFVKSCDRRVALVEDEVKIPGPLLNGFISRWTLQLEPEELSKREERAVSNTATYA